MLSNQTAYYLIVLCALQAVAVQSFIVAPSSHTQNNNNGQQQHGRILLAPKYAQKEETVQVTAQLDDEKITSLFAWVSRAFAGDERYGNLMLGEFSKEKLIGGYPSDEYPLIA
jgi:uncharacterized membrane protein (UPF0182 family)